MNLKTKIRNRAMEAEETWKSSYGLFSKVISDKKLKIGVEIGVAFGGHAQCILNVPSVEKLYGVDPYIHQLKYDDPMNLPQDEFNELYHFLTERLSSYGNRYKHIRKYSNEAVHDIGNDIDFVYIDANHSYDGVLEDLSLWYPKVKIGGVIGGHDYYHPSFPGVAQAVDKFFNQFDRKVNYEGNYVWWIEKKN